MRPWRHYLAVITLVLPLAAAAEEAVVWPKGHFPLPVTGDVIGEVYTVTVQQGQTLLDIAREHNMGYEEMRHANPGVSVWMPREGTEVVIPARFILPDASHTGIVVNLAELRLYHFPEPEAGEPPRVETYPIGIGRAGFNTPLGITKTTMRLEDPAWYPPPSVRQEAARRGDVTPDVVPPGPGNPLGRHAILLDIPSYLIHGTDRPEAIGMRRSYGCIRMYPEDIESIFWRVANETRVEIVDQPIKAGLDDGEAYVQIYRVPEGQEHTPSALLKALSRLEHDGIETTELSYEQLGALLDSPSGQVVALEPPTPAGFLQELSP